MTDITELAQREKFEAWAEERCALPWGYLKNRRTNTGYFSKHDYTSLWAAWKAAGTELVEALEKAQDTINEMDNRIRKQNRHVCELFDDNTALRQRIAELEREYEHLRPVGVMSEKAFHRLENSESRFIALWPRPGIFLPRKRPEDGVIVYARTAAPQEVKGE